MFSCGSCGGVETSSCSRHPPELRASIWAHLGEPGKAQVNSTAPPSCQRGPRRGKPASRNRTHAVRRRDHSVRSGASSIPVDTDSISRAARAPTPIACGFATSDTGNAHETRWQPEFASAGGQKSARLRLLTWMSDTARPRPCIARVTSVKKLSRCFSRPCAHPRLPPLLAFAAV